MLGVVYDELAELGERAIDRAIEAYEAALDVYQPEIFPSEARANANNLAGALLRTGRPAEALDVARTGLRAAELLYGSAATEEAREPEIDENTRLYRLATEAAFDAGRPAAEAFELGEAGRGRLLGDWLAVSDIGAPREVPADLVADEARARAEVRESLIEARLATSDDDRSLAAARAARARRELEGLWSEMESHQAGAAFVAERRGAGLSARRLQGWLDEQPGRAAIIVISAIRDRPIAFTAIAGSDGPELLRYRVTHGDVNDLLRRVDSELIAATSPARRETWTSIGEQLIGPALERLGAEITVLYVVPLGGLHAVPWHASVVDGAPLIARFPVVYAPSAFSAVQLARPADLTPTPDDHAVVIGDPDQSLKYARREAEAVAAQLGATPLLGAAATVANTRRLLAGAPWVHLAAHGHYQHVDPLSSGVVLADGVLAARELLGGFAPRAMVLSACETGHQAAATGDELWGLARALLYAGAQTALLSLWRVLDRTTERLMTRFYAALLASTEPAVPAVAAALRTAMLQTREEDSRAFFWAPFTLLGNPY
jgi:CHAT domain-containing protein